ncbi:MULTISPECIES: NAD(P)H-binding protein [Arthrobacter]|uniref:NAD(P)-binding domain-containing protein n=1 Tax=Arthrobacter psychrochitiniphilus TaxID=291045 RepID=A0A2V3DNK6_9MICC|nr:MULTISPECIES: NAD(P)H-binding protein [Arthrobacter]NYG18536.1 uncharacterized protein YbjT (DUF2867 family) [Arthrobacter psychrochitiniphilus]PXA64347.1 hypothetical protein CVS29_15525 [Arthrobacter psychrochitiniphilus]
MNVSRTLARDTAAQLTKVITVSRSGLTPEGTLAIQGDTSNTVFVTEASSGSDAVVVTVGGTKGEAQPHTAVTQAVIAAKHAAGLYRLVVHSHRR